MLHPSGNIKWNMLSSTHYTGHKEGYDIVIHSGDPNYWYIYKGKELVDCAQYHPPTKESAMAKVQSEKYLNEILNKKK